MALQLTKIGPGASLQDRGRYGWQRYGVSVSGPMDWLAAELANQMVGNDADAAVLELDQMGIAAEALGDCALGLCAPGGHATLNGDEINSASRITLQSGDQFSLHPARHGGWAYLAIAGGGFDGKMQLGSVSYHRRAKLGGPPLANGLKLFSKEAASPPLSSASFPLVEQLYQTKNQLRLIMGPQDFMLSPKSITQFMDGGFTLSHRSDRMGYRLTGEPMQHMGPADIVSDGIAMGTIQVPGDGHPIILMADRQTSGGYPKLGTLITADLPRLAQSPIGQQSAPLRFEAVTVEQAIELLSKLQQAAAQILAQPQPLGPRTPTTDILLRNNLIHGFSDDN